MGDDLDDEEHDDDPMEEMATEENHDAQSNVRSSSVTGRYMDAAGPKGNLLGSGALSAAANSNVAPSNMDGFSGIVGVSAGGGIKGAKGGTGGAAGAGMGVGAGAPKKGPDGKVGAGVNLQVNAGAASQAAGKSGVGSAKPTSSTPSNAEGGMLSIAGVGVNGAVGGQNQP